MSNSSERFQFSKRTSHLRFENGLEVLVLRDDFAPVVSVQGWVRVGSMHEEEFLGGGISHLIEHLVFKKTKHFDGQEIAKAVQEIGGQLNAYTSFDRTVYYVDGPAEGWETAIRVVSDLIFFPQFPDDEFEREKEVIRREIAMGKDDPERVLGEALFKLCFAGHPCRHPVIGYLEAFNQITLEDVKCFHARHYAPNNVFLVITGDITDNQVREWVETNLSSVERKMRAPVVLPTEPRQVGVRRDVISFDTEVSRVDLAWRIPSLTHPDMPVLDVMARVLGSGRSSRLYRKIREELQLAHSVSASSYTPGHDGLFVLNADTEPEKVEVLVEALRDEVKKLVQDGVTDAELEKAKRGVLSAMYGGLSTTTGLAGQLGGAWLLTGGLDLAQSYLGGIERVTNDAIRRVAGEWLTDDGECLVVVNPRNAESEEVSDDSQKSVSRLMPDVLPAVHSSGLQILVGPIHRVPLVSLQLAFLAGSQADPEGKAGLAQLTAKTLLKGTKTRSADALMDALESRGGRIGASSGNNTLSLGVSVMKDDLALAMEILSEVLTSPLLPQQGFELERAAQLQSIKESEDHLVSLAMREARAILYQGTVLENGALGSKESVGTIEHSDVEGFVNSRIVGSGGVVSVFGDVERQEVLDLLNGMPLNAGDVDRVKSVNRLVTPVTTMESRVLHRDKQQGVVVIAFPAPGVGHPDSNALQLLNEASSDMASRLFQRIREEQGLAYYVSTTMFQGIGGGMFSFYLGTDPEKLDHAEAEMRAEILRLVTEGLDDEELFRAKQSMRGSLIMQSQSHSAMGTKAMIDHLLGMGWNAVENDLKEIEKLTREDVAAAAARWLVDSGVTVRVQP